MACSSAKTDMHSAKTVASGERQAILRQIAGADSFGGADGAVVEAFGSGQNFHQRGFAGTVRADEPDAIPRGDHPVRSFEQELVAKAFAGGGELNHGGNSIVS